MDNIVNANLARDLVNEYKKEEQNNILHVESSIPEDLERISMHIVEQAIKGKSQLIVQIPNNYVKLPFIFIELEELGFVVNSCIGQKFYPPPRLPDNVRLLEIKWQLNAQNSNF